MSNDASTRSWWERLGHLLARPKNRQELRQILSEATDQQLLEISAFRMIEGVLKVYERQVRDIMIPRAQMVVIDVHSPLEVILPLLISSAHSRFPVIKETKGEVVGILLAKDLLCYMTETPPSFDIYTLLRPATFIPESKRLNLLLEEFRIKHNHIAIVVDEYGDVCGMLTIEDVLEEIVGEIEDEYDITEAKTDIAAIKEQIYHVKGLTPIEEFNTFFNTKWSDEDFDTIGGLVTMQFGYLPKRDESVTIAAFKFKVIHADKRKIRLLEVTTPLALTPTPYLKD